VLALNYKLKSSPANDVAVLDWSSRAVRTLTNEKSKDHTWQIAAWSSDGRSGLANRANSGATDSSVFLIDVASGTTEELTPHCGVYCTSVERSRPMESLCWSRRMNSNVAIVDVASKKLKWLTDVQWEARAGEFSPDGQLASYVINADGLETTYLYDLSSGKATSVPMPPGLTSPAATPNTFSPKGTSLLLLSYQSSQRSSDFWVYDIASKKQRQLTYSAVASLNPGDLPAA
jgi:Tol biopolymer transport system component